MPSTTNVNAQTLGSTQPITLPQTPAPVIPTIPLSLADKAVAATQTQLTDAQKLQENTISKQMQSILDMNALGTEAQAKQQELTNLGYTQKTTRLSKSSITNLQKTSRVRSK